MKKQILVITFIVLYSLSISAQEQKLFGINNMLDLNNNKNKYEIGVVYEQQLSKHSGFETGLYYRKMIFSKEISIFLSETSNNYSGSFKIRENYISIPLLYKYYFSIINVSIGANIDYFLGWNEIGSTSSEIILNDYGISPKIHYGFVAKISKPFKVYSNFVIEPEMKFNPQINYSMFYYGIGISAKYLLDSK